MVIMDHVATLCENDQCVKKKDNKFLLQSVAIEMIYHCTILAFPGPGSYINFRRSHDQCNKTSYILP